MRLPESVLFVGAHCDDIELFAGGLLAELCFRRTHRVGVLVFSDHRGVADDDTAMRARREMLDNLSGLAADSGTAITDHSDVMLPACRGEFESGRGLIYAALERLRGQYELVVTHPTSDTNQDHRQVAVEATRVFKAHATVLGGEFPSNDIGDFRAAVYVPISQRAVEAKVRMIDAYRSQQQGGRPYFDAAVTQGLAAVRGSQVRAPLAEAFCVNSRIVLTG